MKTPLLDRIPFAKIAIVLAMVMMVGLGLCGVGAAISDGGNRTGVARFVFEALMFAGLAGFWLSALGLILLIPLWVILAIVKSSKGD